MEPAVAGGPHRLAGVVALCERHTLGHVSYCTVGGVGVGLGVDSVFTVTDGRAVFSSCNGDIYTDHYNSIRIVSFEEDSCPIVVNVYIFVQLNFRASSIRMDIRAAKFPRTYQLILFVLL